MTSTPPAVRRGYRFWGPVVAAILITEALAAVGDWLDDDLEVVTISGTIGHLQELWSGVVVIVVGLLAALAFHALTYRSADADTVRRTEQGRPISEEEPKTLGFYDWWFAVGAAVLAGLLAWWLTDDEYVWGYAVYGAFVLFGLVIPTALFRFGHRETRIPSLVYTFRYLRLDHAWIATVVVAGLAILTIHLALYPWPDITQEPKEYAGLTERDAQRSAEHEVERLRRGQSRLVYSTQTRGIDNGRDAWIVFFSVPTGTQAEYSGCLVVVTEAGVSPSPECAT